MESRNYSPAICKFTAGSDAFTEYGSKDLAISALAGPLISQALAFHEMHRTKPICAAHPTHDHSPPAASHPAMTTQVIRYADTADTPWANGLGATRLLWSDPTGERRISIAKLEAPAPFSPLPGMARLLMVLDEISIKLGINGQQVELQWQDKVAFSGADAVELLQLNKPGRVLNLMALASRWEPQLSNHADHPPFARVVLDDTPCNGESLQRGDIIFRNTPIRQSLGIHFWPAPSTG